MSSSLRLRVVCSGGLLQLTLGASSKHLSLGTGLNPILSQDFSGSYSNYYLVSRGFVYLMP